MQVTEAIIAPYIDRIVDAFDPLRIVVFGSCARGDARPGSDVDLLVVVEEEDIDKRETAIEMRRLLRDAPFPKDVVTTPGEIKRRGDMVGWILRPALREGKIVYERS